MRDPDLLEATGSEPLTYDEEVEMQQSWLNDKTKCTFIVHAIEACQHTIKKFETASEMESSSENNFLVEDNLDAMIGDVNLFLSEMEDSYESDRNENSEIREVKTEVTAQGMGSSKKMVEAEVDIMIARREFRGKGLGRAATCAMLLYGATKLGIHRFFCKINEDNTDSIRLFKAIGFVECDYAACFKQVELELWKTLPEMEGIFKELGGSYSITPCSVEE